MSRTGRRPLLALATVAATTAALAFGVSAPAGAAPAPSEDTGLLRTVTLNADLGFPEGQATGTPSGIQTPEFPPSEEQAETDRSNTLDRGFARVSPTGVPIVAPTAVGGSPGLTKSFMGLDGFDQRYANNGNQFSIEPPDQALCVGGGYVLEAVNDVLQVYSPSGSAATGVTDLNTFFGYPAAIDRTTGEFGPFVTDPVCLFDEGVQRFFVTVLTLDIDPGTGDLTTTNHLDTAVSRTANPLDGFVIYRLPVTDNGEAGTPAHKGCPCLGDYPHIGADKYGYYISTNEYPFSDASGIFGNNFNGAQIYAFDKLALAARAKNVNVVQFSKTQIQQNGTAVPGFTVSPATVPDTAYQTANNGTEYFLSSIAGEEAQPQGFTGQADAIGVYTLTNTASLSDKQPSVKLMKALRPSERYVQPPLATQKLGPTPLADYCSQVDCFGSGPQQFAEGPIATNDTRMLQVYFANGTLYGALNTGVQVSGHLQAGIAWFLLNPGTSPSTASVAHQGYIGVAGHNVMFPAVAAMTNGKGAMVYTLSGPSYYPTAAYSLVGSSGVTGAVNIAATGGGPQDGFSQYLPESDPGTAPRPRWGDYSAAEAVGSTIWLATEYIGPSCTFAQFQVDQTCGNIRAPLFNWATRIASVTP